MDDEIGLFSDGDGLALVGQPRAVERFLDSVGLTSSAVEPARLGSVLRARSSAAQAGSEIAANSGRWLKLTKESAEQLSHVELPPTKTPGVKHAMLDPRGDIKGWLQVTTGPGSLVSNPAVLSGAAGIMAQLAMQQAMDEITDYLATIDQKLDDVLRTQTNQVLARMDGVALAVKEATSVRDAVGRVSEVTWSKVQSTPTTVLETQGFALRQLADLADKIEQKTKVGDLAKVAKDAEADVQKWIAVLARCFQLHDAIAVLELDRVLDASPDELDRHRLGLKAAREDRLALIAESTQTLLDRMSIAVERANSKVLFNPVPRHRRVEQPRHRRGPRTARAARHRVRQPVVRSTALEERRRRALGQGPRDRLRRPRRSQGTQQRYPRSGQVGEGQTRRQVDRPPTPRPKRRDARDRRLIVASPDSVAATGAPNS